MLRLIGGFLVRTLRFRERVSSDFIGLGGFGEGGHGGVGGSSECNGGM